MCEGFRVCDFVSRRVQKAYHSSDFMISAPAVAYYPENVNTNNRFTDEADNKHASHLRIICIFSSSALTLLVVTFAFQLPLQFPVSSKRTRRVLRGAISVSSKGKDLIKVARDERWKGGGRRDRKDGGKWLCV